MSIQAVVLAMAFPSAGSNPLRQRVGDGEPLYTPRRTMNIGGSRRKQHTMPDIFVVLMQDCACFPVFSI